MLSDRLLNINLMKWDDMQCLACLYFDILLGFKFTSIFLFLVVSTFHIVCWDSVIRIKGLPWWLRLQNPPAVWKPGLISVDKPPATKLRIEPLFHIAGWCRHVFLSWENPHVGRRPLVLSLGRYPWNRKPGGVQPMV